MEQLRKSFEKYVSSKYYALFLGVISGNLVFYFLYFLDAYGIQKGLSYSGHGHLFRSVCFGILTFSYLAVCEFWLKPKLSLPKLKNVLIWYAALILLGCQLIFLLFNYFWNWQEFDAAAYFLILKEFPLLMLLPLAIYLGIKSMVKPLEQEEAYLHFQSMNGKDQLKTRLRDFLYANSDENYIGIFYLSNGEVKKHLIRKPLKKLEEELKTYQAVSRAHRSYLVNKVNVQAVQQVNGKVYLDVKGNELPVSKKFQNNFLS